MSSQINQPSNKLWQKENLLTDKVSRRIGTKKQLGQLELQQERANGKAIKEVASDWDGTLNRVGKTLI